MALKAAEFREITKPRSLRHSRSLKVTMFGTIESPHATSYV